MVETGLEPGWQEEVNHMKVRVGALQVKKMAGERMGASGYVQTYPYELMNVKSLRTEPGTQ